MKIKFKKLHPDAKMPQKAHPTDAGFDLTATSKTKDEYGKIVYGTGIAIEIPEGYVGLVFPRSSIAKYGVALSNCVGVIDSCYRGEIMAKFTPLLGFEETILPSYPIGQKIVQLIIIPIPNVEFELSDSLSETDRGINGYGSSGV